MSEGSVDKPVAVDDWDEHWGSYASSAEDNPAQRYRRQLAFGYLAAEGAPLRLVDIGSGQGDLLASAALTWPGAELLGVELSAAGIAEGRRKVPSAAFVQRNLLLEADPGPSFRSWASHAVCSEVLEHVDDPVGLLRRGAEFMRPGCRVVVTVPGGPRSAFDLHIGHRRHYTTSALYDVLLEAGYHVEAVHAAGFPVFNLYKLVVMARGQRLVSDVESANQDTVASRAARGVMRAFDSLIRFARPDSRWGWQLVAVARAR